MILLSLALAFIVTSACRQSDRPFFKSSQGKEYKLKILTTMAPLYSFTVNITGGHAEVLNLLPSGAGPHDYSFSPADVKRVAKADVIIKNGAGLETWLDNVIASAGKKGLVVVNTSNGIDIINNDPHIWLSPQRAMTQVKNIKNALVKADPDRESIYTANAENYLKLLDNLDKSIRDEINQWSRKEFVAFHSAYLYFTMDYGLEQVAVIQESPEGEPSPQHIGNVIKTIREKGLQSIFTEPQASHKIVDMIAQDLHLKVYNLDTLEAGELYPGWYENRMKKNLTVLKEVLH
jgi:zinc/manganese transport system substrate-binding protein